MVGAFVVNSAFAFCRFPTPTPYVNKKLSCQRKFRTIASYLWT